MQKCSIAQSCQFLAKVILLSSLFSVSTASAAIVSWTYSGTLTQVDQSYTNLYRNGDTFTGEFTFDTDSLASSELPRASYGQVFYSDAIISGLLTIGDYSVSMSTENNSITVMNDYKYGLSQEFLGDGFEFSSFLTQADPAISNPDYFALRFLDLTGTSFDGYLLPDGSFDVSVFQEMTLSIVSSDSGLSVPVLGVIDSVSITTVPLPAAAWLFLTGGFGLMLTARRKAV